MWIFHARIPTNCMNASQYTPCTRQMYYARFILSHKFTRYITNFPQLPQKLTHKNSRYCSHTTVPRGVLTEL